MPAKKTKSEKNFDAVRFMREQRDRISEDIADMNFKEIKAYFKKRRSKRPAANNVHTQ